MTEFVHLHNHSDFSLLDGAATVQHLVGKAVEHRMPAVALTDHGNMFGVLKFYKECRRQEIKPIVGCEFYLAPESRHVKTGGEKSVRYHHLVLLARDEAGYRNLLKLSSLSFTEGFYYRPRIDEELLTRHAGGLLGMSACLGGEIPALIQENRLEEAVRRAGFYRDLLGEGNFYLELQDHGIPEQKTVIKGLLEIARRTGLPLAASNDIHYPEKADALAQDVLICVGTNKKLSDGKRMKFQFPEFYFKSAEEMARAFDGLPEPQRTEALRNTLRIAERCDLAIPLPGPLLPDYQVPEGATLQGYLRELAHRGLEGRYRPATPQMRQRLDYELSVIESMGYEGYFLIVWDFIHYARGQGIPVGPGRGSGVGSLVAYSLGITDIDPLRYNLLFERFLNPERVSLPDFDVDFDFERREEVIEYVNRKYGAERVGQIITFGTLKARAAIRDVARVLDVPLPEADRIAKLIPAGSKSLAEAMEQEPELKKVAAQGGAHRELMEISRKLEGLSRHASTHASGIVIGREELSHYVPLYRDPKTGAVSTQYSMDFLEECGLVKMDFLGLKTLTLIRNTLALLERRGVKLESRDIPEDDAATFRLLSEGRSTCIFQFESSGMQGLLKRARPESIEDLIALNALYRPGPMQWIDQFVDAKTGRVPIKYPLPELEPILKPTYGVIVYQEQVMEIARKVAGFSLGEADILRRAMGKKKKDVMAKMKEQFIEGAKLQGYARKVAEGLFEMLIPFAEYGFNKSHAAAYSVLAYRTAYLKANHPAEFMAANLTNEIHDTDKLTEYILECREMGLEILPPDINLSERDFSVSDGRIVYGLMGIKNLGSQAVEEIVAERGRGGPYAHLQDFLERVDLKVANRKVVETLILCGVFDRFGRNRATQFQNLDPLLDMVNRVKEARRYGQASLFDALGPEEMPAFDWQPVEDWPILERLQHEKDNLGFFFSGHPLDRYREIIRRATTLDLTRLESASTERLYTLVGLLHVTREIVTSRGQKMAFARLEDLKGSIEVILFPEVYEKGRELLGRPGALAVRGKVDRSRGEPKLKAEGLMDPADLAEREPQAVHVRIGDEPGGEEALIRIRDYLIDKPGRCAVYFHLPGPGGGDEVVIKASPQLTLAADDGVLSGLAAYPQVVEIWKE